MERKSIEDLLTSVAQGQISITDACERLAVLPYQDLGFAKIDSHRALRQGYPEVIFCPGKTPEQIVEIARKLRALHPAVIATRAEPAQAASVLDLWRTDNNDVADLGDFGDCEYLEQPKSIVFGQLPPQKKNAPSVAIITAGTADIGVAEEAALLIVAAGYPVSCVYDVGVAGVQRLFDNLALLRQSHVTIVVAGMDGALASVVGGLLEKPVIAVPTSIGYGSSFGGVAALLSMLNSCAAGLTVVNIDNGFGAAMAALRILASNKSE